MVKIILEREKCIGCGSCQAFCPKYWQLADDGKIDFLDSKQIAETKNFEKELKEPECNQEAADACPVQCIRIEK